MASGVYQRFLANIMNKLIDLSAGDTITCALMTDSHSFTGTHNTWSQVSANEITGTGYTTPGKDLTTPSVTQGSPTYFDADDVEWTSASFSAYHAVLYDNTLAGDDLIASFDFGGVQTVTSGTFKIQWAAGGIVTLTPS